MLIARLLQITLKSSLSVHKTQFLPVCHHVYVKRILLELIRCKVNAHRALLMLTHGRIKAKKTTPMHYFQNPSQNRIEKRPDSAALIWSCSILAPAYEKADCARGFCTLVCAELEESTSYCQLGFFFLREETVIMQLE